MITWSADGMKQSIQDAIPPLRGLVTGVQTSPDDGTIKLQGNLGSVTTKAAGYRRTSGAAGGRCHRAGFVAAQRDGAVGAILVHHPSHRELSARYPCRQRADHR